jgi:diguanylate cyclase (GGDEF)-like protein
MPEFLDSTALDDLALFDRAPVSMWLEDASQLKRLMDEWRELGVVNLSEYLRSSPELVQQAWRSVVVQRVNRRAVTVSRAPSAKVLQCSLFEVVCNGSAERGIAALDKFWRWPEGARDVQAQSVNYRLDGESMDVRIHLTLLGAPGDWSQMLVVIDDISELADAQRQLSMSGRYARDLFEHSPVSLWVQDMSDIRLAMDALRAQGVSDLQLYMKENPAWVQRAMLSIRLIDVNQATLRLFQAESKQQLLAGLDMILTADEQSRFESELLMLWNGKLSLEQECLKHTFKGEPRYIQIQVAVMAGHEQQWDRVLLSMADITAQKSAQAQLMHLSRHDSLTQLANRAWFTEVLYKLREEPVVSLVAVDLNGLKELNDVHGHAAGDANLQRMAKILLNSLQGDMLAARLGGDEFAIILPKADPGGCRRWIDLLVAAIEHSNRSEHARGAQRLSVSIGGASRRAGEALSATLARADNRMYQAKRQYYDSIELDRRARGQAAPDFSDSTVGFLVTVNSENKV